MPAGTNRLGHLLIAVVVLCGVASPAIGDTVRYFHLDGIGNVRAITNQAGTVVERHDYLPFGEECTTGPCASNPGVGAGQPRKFTGKERDAETGLDYFGARYYSSKIARFSTVDPAYTWRENLVDPQRWNRYAYARNNPLRYVDPDGRVIKSVVIAGRIAKAIYKGENVYSTVSGIVTDVQTIGNTDPRIGTLERLGATADLIGELSGASDLFGAAKTMGRAVDKTSDAAKRSKRAFSRKDREDAFQHSRDADAVARCEYCDEGLVWPKGSPNSYEADHRDAWSRGGTSDPDNLATSCRNCNRQKSNKVIYDEWVPPKDRSQ